MMMLIVPVVMVAVVVLVAVIAVGLVTAVELGAATVVSGVVIVDELVVNVVAVGIAVGSSVAWPEKLGGQYPSLHVGYDLHIGYNIERLTNKNYVLENEEHSSYHHWKEKASFLIVTISSLR